MLEPPKRAAEWDTYGSSIKPVGADAYIRPMDSGCGALYGFVDRCGRCPKRLPASRFLNCNGGVDSDSLRSLHQLLSFLSPQLNYTNLLHEM